MISEPAGIVLYDGDCNLCIRLADFFREKDREGRLRFIPGMSDEGRTLAAGCDDPGLPGKTLIYFREGKYFTYSTAALKIFRDLGRGWRVLYYLLTIIPVSIRDVVYRLIASSRRHISGTHGSCPDCGI